MPAANTRTSAPARVARPLRIDDADVKAARGIGGRQHVAHHEVHAVGARAGQRQIEIAVAVDVGPLHAVIGLQLADRRRRDVDERRAGVAEQRVLPAGAAGDRAVDVEIELAVVIEVGERARVVARVDRDVPRRGAILERALAAVAEEAERAVVGGEQIEVAVVVDVGRADAHGAVRRRASARARPTPRRRPRRRR